jgi:hypothetical protein
MSKLLIDEPPLCVLPSLACLVGDRPAIMLQQMHYWLARSTHEYDGETWFYASDEDWHRQMPFWCVRTIQRIIERLLDYGVVKIRPYHPDAVKQTRWWYRIDYAALAALTPRKRTRQSVNEHDKLSDPSSSEISRERKNLQDFPSSREEEDPPPPTPDSAAALPLPPEEVPAPPAAVVPADPVSAPAEPVQAGHPTDPPPPRDQGTRPAASGAVSPVYQNGVQTEQAAPEVPHACTTWHKWRYWGDTISCACCTAHHPDCRCPYCAPTYERWRYHHDADTP